MSRRSAQRRRPRLSIGESVAYLGAHRLPGVGPMTELVVTAVHKNGTVDVKIVRQHERFTGIDPADLQSIE
jgi:hypothetical protein